MRALTLSEYQTTPAVELSLQQLRDLRAVAPSVAVTPTLDHDGYYDLTPGAQIGAINLGELSIVIRPKLPIDRLLFLLSYALDPLSWSPLPFDFQEEPSLVEAVIPGFLAQVRRTFVRGVLQGYRTNEEALTNLRGRVRIDEQVRRHFGQLPPIEVSYDDFTEDIEENRLLKTAIHHLGKLPSRSKRAHSTLRAFDTALSKVSLVPFDIRRLPEIIYTRLNAHYRPAVEFAKLILRSTSFEVRHGIVQASAFLVDMNLVFENFLYVALREALCLSPSVFPQGMRGRQPLYLDEAGAILLQPDLSWWEGSICTFVGDVKYKKMSAAGIIHPDLYQLLAYTIAADLPDGLLIYASGQEEPTQHRVMYAGKHIHVITIDLSGTTEDILGQVKGIAQRIGKLRVGAVRKGR